MKNKFFITLALLAGVLYSAAQYDDPQKDDQWGLDLGPGDNPYVDEWGPDIHPGNRPIQTNKNVTNGTNTTTTSSSNNVDVPGVDDQWGLDK